MQLTKMFFTEIPAATAAGIPHKARREGFEPPTFWSVARRSIQLS